MTVLLLALLVLLAVIGWRTGLLRRQLLRLRDWLLWSPTRALCGGAAVATVLGIAAASAAGGTATPPPAAAPTPSASPAARPIVAASPTGSPAPDRDARDRTAVLDRTRRWVGLFLDGRTADSPEQWRARLRAQSVPSMGMYLAVTPPFAVPDATVQQTVIDELHTYEASTTTFLSDNSQIQLRLTFNGERWMVSDYVRPPA